MLNQLTNSNYRISYNLLQVLHSHRRVDGTIGDICDGELFRSHPLYQQNELALQIIGYLDEVEVCNSLAGHAGVHKLGNLEFPFVYHNNYKMS